MIDKHQFYHKDSGLKMIIINTFVTSMRGLNNFIPNFIEDRFISCGIEYVNIFSENIEKHIFDRCVQSMG